MKLSDAHVVVTGASRGIGAALVRELHQRYGARISMVARSAAPLESLSLETGAAAFPADLAASTDQAALIDRIEAAAGPIDVLINNAALGGVGAFLDMPLQASREHLNANLIAPMELSRAVLPGMIARGRGTIVMVSSLAGEIAMRNAAPYAASKAGLSLFSSNLQRELKDTQINVMLTVLGEVDTSILDAVRADPVMSEAAKRIGKLRALTPQEVASGLCKAIEKDRRVLVLPRAGSPIVGLRLLPSRLMDFALRGMK